MPRAAGPVLTLTPCFCSEQMSEGRNVHSYAHCRASGQADEVRGIVLTAAAQKQLNQEQVQDTREVAMS